MDRADDPVLGNPVEARVPHRDQVVEPWRDDPRRWDKLGYSQLQTSNPWRASRWDSTVIINREPPKPCTTKTLSFRRDSRRDGCQRGTDLCTAYSTLSRNLRAVRYSSAG